MGRKRRGDAVDGVLLLDKPGGISSNLALQQARRLLNAAKAGHAGTLDPLATGLLPVLLGEATKFSADLLDADKTYEAVLQLGVTTTTADAEGAVVERRPVAVEPAQLDAVLARFVGTIAQVPPMHSALKHAGRALYQYARDGVDIERAPRTVTIHRLALRMFEGDRVALEVACSKGTYVRTLAEDIGAALGCGAHLAGLRRTQVGRLTQERSVALVDLEAMPPIARREWLLPLDALLQDLERIDLGAPQAARFTHGNELELGLAAGCPPGRKRVYGPDDHLLGVAELNLLGVLQPRRLLSQEARP